MIIRFRPGGLCPSTYSIDKVFDSIKEDADVTIDSIELLERIILGIAEGQVPYGNTVLTIYDQTGNKHSTKFSNIGQPYNPGIFDVWPLSRKKDTHIKMEMAKTEKNRSAEICGNCSWNIAELCLNETCERYNTYVSDFEEACHSGFSDAHKDHLLELKLAQKQSPGAQNG